MVNLRTYLAHFGLFYLRPLFLIPLLILVKHSILGLSLSQYLPTAVFAVPVQEGVELHEQDPLPFCAPSLGDREEQVHLRVLQGEQEAPPSIYATMSHSSTKGKMID